MSGKLILVIGPSGSGKSTLIELVRRKFPDLVSPVSCTTRAMRDGENDGHIYFFLSRNEFERRVEAGDFLEWAEYGSNLYGTLKEEILPALEEGRNILREVEVQGARQIKKLLPSDQLRIIFIDAGNWDDLERRILSRGQIGSDELKQRRERTVDEISFRSQADVLVNNSDGRLDMAQEEMESAIEKFIS